MMPLTLDHVVIAVEDLDIATADYTALFGRQPSWRGSHPKYGTRNALWRLDNTYVELLALGGGRKRDARWAGELQRALKQHGEGVYALALGTVDVDSTSRELRERELPVQDARDGEGADELTGAVRHWRNAVVPVKSTNGVRIFFIEHKSPAEALPPAPHTADERAAVRRMDHAVILSPDMEQSRRLWERTLEARLALDRTFPERNTRILFFRLGDVTIEISGGAAQTEEGMNKPDRLWGIAWGVDDVAAAVERLRAAGVDVSDVRRGVKPGTLVATAKGPATHGVATLLIEHTPESFRPESREPHGLAYDRGPERRAFRALALDRVTVATADAEAAASTWQKTLGLAVERVVEPEGQPLRLAAIPAGNAYIELAQPLSDRHRVAQWIAERGPGMYAIAIEVDDIDAAVSDLRAKGVLVSDVEYGAWAGTRIARIERTAAHGVSIQLVQRLPDVL
jgi:methylmalonyl-CoA epimerase